MSPLELVAPHWKPVAGMPKPTLTALAGALLAGATALLLVGDADAARRVQPREPEPTPTASRTILEIHHRTCPEVVEYTDCAAVTVEVADFGATGWTGSSGPAAGVVRYNSYYVLSDASWAQTVSHELGGHHDAWHELVAKVGVTQAWTDYYDLDYFAERWAEARWVTVTGTRRDLTMQTAKEVYLDCAGPVSHGYRGNYLSNRGVATTTRQAAFCRGHQKVMADAIARARPA